MNWLEKYLGGHISVRIFGIYVVLFGFNAMHVALHVRLSPSAVLCFHPPMRCFKHWWPWYFYISPNGTPSQATFLLGPGTAYERRERARRTAEFSTS